MDETLIEMIETARRISKGEQKDEDSEVRHIVSRLNAFVSAKEREKEDPQTLAFLYRDNLMEASNNILRGMSKEKYRLSSAIIKEKALMTIAFACLFLADRSPGSMSRAIVCHSEMLLAFYDVDGQPCPLENPLRQTGRTQRVIVNGIHRALNENNDIVFVGFCQEYCGRLAKMAKKCLDEMRVAHQFSRDNLIKLMKNGKSLTFKSPQQVKERGGLERSAHGPILIYDHYMPDKAAT